MLGIGFPRHGVPESGRREEKCTVEQLGEHECIDEGFALCGYRLLYDEDWFRLGETQGAREFLSPELTVVESRMVFVREVLCR